MRRFLPPQRDAIREILRSNMEWPTGADQRKLGEQPDQMTRVVEPIAAVRDPLATIPDEIDAARAERLNRNLHVLSMISAVFLPLGVLTGLMGISVAGTPGAEWPPALWVFTATLGAIAAGVLTMLRLLSLL